MRALWVSFWRSDADASAGLYTCLRYIRERSSGARTRMLYLCALENPISWARERAMRLLRATLYDAFFGYQSKLSAAGIYSAPFFTARLHWDKLANYTCGRVFVVAYICPPRPVNIYLGWARVGSDRVHKIFLIERGSRKARSKLFRGTFVKYYFFRLIECRLISVQAPCSSKLNEFQKTLTELLHSPGIGWFYSTGAVWLKFFIKKLMVKSEDAALTISESICMLQRIQR